MAGPSTASDVIAWAKVAITKNYYVPSVHFGERLVERRVDMLDIHNSIDRSIRAERYDDAKPVNGGTTWRIYGPDADGDRILGVGIEAYRSPDRKPWITLCTVIES